MIRNALSRKTCLHSKGDRVRPVVVQSARPGANDVGQKLAHDEAKIDVAGENVANSHGADL